MVNKIQISLYNLGYEVERDEAGSVLYDLEEAGMLPSCREHSECPIECIDFCDFSWEQECE